MRKVIVSFVLVVGLAWVVFGTLLGSEQESTEQKLKQLSENEITQRFQSKKVDKDSYFFTTVRGMVEVPKGTQLAEPVTLYVTNLNTPCCESAWIEIGEEIKVENVKPNQAWSFTLSSNHGNRFQFFARSGEYVSEVVKKSVGCPEFSPFVCLTLQKGFEVSGTVQGAGIAEGSGWAILYPATFDQQWMYRKAKIQKDGSFRFEGLRDCYYILEVVTDQAGPDRRLVLLDQKKVKLPQLQLTPRGRIEGVYLGADDTPMANQTGTWEFSYGVTVCTSQVSEKLFGDMQFTTDKEGRFVIPNVPAKKIWVGFFENTKDSSGRKIGLACDVKAGEPTKLFAYKPRGLQDKEKGSSSAMDFSIDLVVGDGSVKDFLTGTASDPDCHKRAAGEQNTDSPQMSTRVLCSLKDTSGRSVDQLMSRRPTRWSMYMTAGTKGACANVLQGVFPGKYQISIFEREEIIFLYGPEQISPFLSKSFEVGDTHQRSPLEIRLPNSSVGVKMLGPESSDGEEIPLSPLLVALISKKDNRVYVQGPCLRECPIQGGGWGFIRFVPPGNYEILGWHYLCGWARSKPFEVHEGEVVQLEPIQGHKGTHLYGKATFSKESRLPHYVKLIDADGVTIREECIREKCIWIGKTFHFSETHLWPSRWTAKIFDDEDNLLAEGSCDITGKEEKVELHLQGK